jgi:hypothetical protein
MDSKEKLLSIDYSYMGWYGDRFYRAEQFYWIEQYESNLTYYYRPHLEEISEWLKTTKHNYSVYELDAYDHFIITFEDKQGAMEFKLRFIGV